MLALIAPLRLIFQMFYWSNINQQTVTEASAMETYATENSLIDKEHIIKEEQATTTAENAYYSRIIVDDHDAVNVHVVTSQFHMERAKNIFEKVSTRIYYNKGPTLN